MILADNLRLGDRLQVAPHWEHGEHNATPAAQIATVVYIHPEGRYCTVRYKCGLTDTVQTVPAERVAAPIPEGYGVKVRQSDVSVAMGHSPSWLNHQLDKTLTAAEQQEIIRAVERIAAERAAHDPV